MSVTPLVLKASIDDALTPKLKAQVDALKGMREQLKSTRESLQALPSAAEPLKKSSEEADALKKSWGDAVGVVERMTKAMTAVGISADDQAAALERARRLSQETGASLSETVAALDGQVAKARAGLRKAFEPPPTEKIEEPVVKLTGRVGELHAALSSRLTPGTKHQAEELNRLRNEVDDVTDQLKLFGERGVQMANALEEISDPLERVRLGQQYLRQEVAGGGGAFGKLNDAASRLKVEWESLGVAGQGLITGIVAGSTAATVAAAKLAQVVVEYGVASWQEYAKTNAAAKAALEDFDKAVSASNVLIGKNVEEYLRVTDTIVGLTSGIEGVTAALNDSESSVSNTIKSYREMATVVPILNTVVDLTDKLATSIANVGAESRKASRESDKFYRDLGGRYSEDIEQNAEGIFAARDARMTAFKNRDDKASKTAIGAVLTAEGLKEVEAAKELNKQGTTRLALYRQVDAAVAQIEAREARILDLVGKGIKTAREVGGRAAKLDVEKTASKELEQIDKAAKKFSELRFNADIDADKQLQQKAFADAAKLAAPWITASEQIQAGFLSIGLGAITMGVMVARGTASLGDFGRAFAQQLGGLFVQVGSGLALSGLGLEALFSGNPAGAVSFGAGLAAVGAVLQGFASKSAERKKAATTPADGGARLTALADRFLGDKRDGGGDRNFALYISQDVFDDAVMRATNRGAARGRLSRQALPAGFIGGA